MRVIHPKICIVLILFIVGVSSCIPLSPSSQFPLALESPTARSCSLEALTSSINTLHPASTERSKEVDRVSWSKWSKYEDTRFGYSFEYPASYDDNPNQECGLTVVNRFGSGGQEVYVGSSVAMFIKQIQHSSWKDDACFIILDHSSISEINLINETVFANEEAMEVSYNATWNPDGRLVLFQHNNLFYIIENIANPKCIIEGTAIEANTVYQHMLKSFRFLDR
jgi:hypothetical protein